MLTNTHALLKASGLSGIVGIAYELFSINIIRKRTHQLVVCRAALQHEGKGKCHGLEVEQHARCLQLSGQAAQCLE